MPHPRPHAGERPAAQGHTVPTHPAFTVARLGIKRYLSLRPAGTLLGGLGEPGQAWQSWWWRTRAGQWRRPAAGTLGTRKPMGLARRWSRAIGGAGKTALGHSVPSGAFSAARLVSPRRSRASPYVYLDLLVSVSIANRIFIQVPVLGTYHQSGKHLLMCGVRSFSGARVLAACLPPGVTGCQAQPGTNRICGKPRVLLVGSGLHGP